MATSFDPDRPRRPSEASQLAQKRGMEPGAAVYTGDMSPDTSTIARLCYGPRSVEERQLSVPSDPIELVEGEVSWFNIDGLSDLSLIATVQAAFGIHPLTIEDILNVSTPAKAEEFDGQIFLVLPMATLAPGERSMPEIEVEHLCILAGPGWVVTFQERPGDVLDPLRQRIRSGAGRVRKRHADYLLHAIADAIVDGYFVVIQAFEEQVIALEEEAVDGRDAQFAQRIHALTSRLHGFRRRLWPLQAAVAELQRMETAFVEPGTQPFFRDLADHVRQAIAILDGARDRLNAVLQLHLALQGHRMNEVMRLLTVVTSIFIPLSFVAGVYGMNFRDMPELQWAYGYPVALAVMASIAVTMVTWFRWRRWF